MGRYTCPYVFEGQGGDPVVRGCAALVLALSLAGTAAADHVETAGVLATADRWVGRHFGDLMTDVGWPEQVIDTGVREPSPDMALVYPMVGGRNCFPAFTVSSQSGEVTGFDCY